MLTIKNSIILVMKILFIFGGSMVAAYSTVSTFVDLPPILQDWRYGLVLGLFLFMGGMGWVLFDLYLRYVWGSNPKIKLIPNAEEELRGLKITKHAYLYVLNEENSSITDCCATIESCMLFDQMRQNEFIEEDCLRWVTKDDKQDCKIQIPPKKQLRIDVADTLEHRLRFSTCNSTQSSPMGIYSHIRIRVDGNFSGKAMKPQRFNGYLYAEEKRERKFNVVETTTKVIDGKRIEDSKQTSFLPYVEMVFEEGNWMKDKRIPKPEEIEQKVK